MTLLQLLLCLNLKLEKKIEMFWEDGLVAHFFPLRKDFSTQCSGRDQNVQKVER